MLKLKELRKQKGLSQEQVANALGISMRAYQNYEYGQREPNIEMINKLADFYEVTTDYLLGRPEAKPPENPVDLVARELKLKEIEESIMKEYFELPEKGRQMFADFMERLVAREEKRRGLVLQSDGTYAKAPDTDVTAKISALEKQNQDLLTRIEAIEKEDMEYGQEFLNEEVM